MTNQPVCRVFQVYQMESHPSFSGMKNLVFSKRQLQPMCTLLITHHLQSEAFSLIFSTTSWPPCCVFLRLTPRILCLSFKETRCYPGKVKSPELFQTALGCSSWEIIFSVLPTKNYMMLNVKVTKLQANQCQKCLTMSVIAENIKLTSFKSAFITSRDDLDLL